MWGTGVLTHRRPFVSINVFMNGFSNVFYGAYLSRCFLCFLGLERLKAVIHH